MRRLVRANACTRMTKLWLRTAMTLFSSVTPVRSVAKTAGSIRGSQEIDSCIERCEVQAAYWNDGVAAVCNNAVIDIRVVLRLSPVPRAQGLSGSFKGSEGAILREPLVHVFQG